MGDRQVIAGGPDTAASTATPVRVLTALYAFFTLAAGGRSGVQLATRAAEAPLAYGLSAFAAVVYLAGAVLTGLAERRPRVRPYARVLCAAELAGVAVVGTASVLQPHLFPHATVWSGYGIGYGFVPLLLPVGGLILLRRSAARP